MFSDKYVYIRLFKPSLIEKNKNYFSQRKTFKYEKNENINLGR